MKTYSKTVAIVREIVAEKPEGYKYTEDPKTAERQAQYLPSEASGTGCYYAHADGSPGCIVGHFVHKLNPDFDLKGYEFSGVPSILHYAGIKVTGDAMQFLGDVQAYQDGGSTWKDAVEKAIQINAGVLY